jgi:hypothetical protein
MGLSHAGYLTFTWDGCFSGLALTARSITPPKSRPFPQPDPTEVGIVRKFSLVCLNMATARSDLVAHFHLDAQVFDDCTIITEDVRGKRNAKQERKWVRSSRRPFAGGGFGSVWLEHEEGNRSNVRAVKVMRKPATRRGFQQDFEQELWALAALSKVSHVICVDLADETAPSFCCRVLWMVGR